MTMSEMNAIPSRTNPANPPTRHGPGWAANPPKSKAPQIRANRFSVPCSLFPVSPFPAFCVPNHIEHKFPPLRGVIA
jgi:hypothetical protein